MLGIIEAKKDDFEHGTMFGGNASLSLDKSANWELMFWE